MLFQVSLQARVRDRAFDGRVKATEFLAGNQWFHLVAHFARSTSIARGPRQVLQSVYDQQSRIDCLNERGGLSGVPYVPLKAMGQSIRFAGVDMRIVRPHDYDQCVIRIHQRYRLLSDRNESPDGGNGSEGTHHNQGPGSFRFVLPPKDLIWRIGGGAVFLLGGSCAALNRIKLTSVLGVIRVVIGWILLLAPIRWPVKVTSTRCIAVELPCLPPTPLEATPRCPFATRHLHLVSRQIG